MKIGISGVVTLLVAVLLAVSETAVAAPPVAKLVEAHGGVHYTRNGKTWRMVRGTKYLFAGYQLETDADGGGKVIDVKTGNSRKLGPNSRIKIDADRIIVLAGTLSQPKAESTSLFQSIANKFAMAQRYTTVRRGVSETRSTMCDSKVRTIRHLTVSLDHPDLVWRNACPEYSYRLVIDGKGHDIPAEATAEMIRYSVKGVSAGKHRYHVEVQDKDGTIYIPRKESSFTMLTRAEAANVDKALGHYPNDVFERADLMENKGMYVAAMDAYRAFFKTHPDDNEMRPMLIEAYQKLKLSNLRQREARLYNANLVEESE